MNDLRVFLEQLEEAGQLRRIDASLSPRFGVARMLAAAPERPMLFTTLVGYPEWRMVGNVVSQRDFFAIGLGTFKEKLLAHLIEALANPRPPGKAGSAPCQEVVLTGDSLTALALPIPRYHPQDAGAYITAGVAVIRDPELGRNLAFHRMLRLDERRFAVRVVEGRGTYNAWQRSPRGLPMAVCIGLPPHILLAAAISAPPGVDEMAIANALAPVETVPCVSQPLEVPAAAELVLEGVLTHDLAEEGPFPDLTGTMDGVRRQPVFELTAITHRHNPIFQALLPGGLEHKNLMGMPREPTIYTEVSRVADCRGVYITPGGCSWLHAVVQIEPHGPGDARQAIDAAFRGHSSLKHVVIVDTDVDIFDASDVEWAIATRFQAGRDLYIFPDRPGSSLDPSARQVEGAKSHSDKMGLDATIPWGADPAAFRRLHY